MGGKFAEIAGLQRGASLHLGIVSRFITLGNWLHNDVSYSNHSSSK